MLFPNINDNLFRFMNDNSQHQLNTMIKRRKKKTVKANERRESSLVGNYRYLHGDVIITLR